MYHLETIELVLVDSNVFNNDYQHHSRVLYTSVLKKSFVHLLDVPPKNFIFLKTFNSDISYIEIQFTE